MKPNSPVLKILQPLLLQTQAKNQNWFLIMEKYTADVLFLSVWMSDFILDLVPGLPILLSQLLHILYI